MPEVKEKISVLGKEYDADLENTNPQTIIIALLLKIEENTRK